MVSNNIKWYLLFLLLAIVVPINAKKSVTLELEGRSNTIAVGDKFQITVSATSDVEGEPPEKPTFKGAELLYPRVGPIHVQRRTVVNGVASSFNGTLWTYTLKATEKGKFIFGPVSFGGVKSNTLHYTISDTPAPDPYQQYGSAYSGGGGGHDADESQRGPKFIGKGNEKIFLVARVSKTKAYEQEALLYTVTLYTSYSGIRFLGATESPKFDGFTLEEANEQVRSLHTEQYQGKAYSAAVIAKYVIFPQMKGRLKITGNKYTITVESRSNYYDPFFGYMSVGNPVQLSVQPNDLYVDVSPLPTPQPAGFSGGVGQFKLSLSHPSSPLVTNQAASIVYRVTGEGNIKYITLPDLNELYPSELEVYSPTTKDMVAVQGATVKGSISFDYSVMPLESGSLRVPSVKLIYFNPATGKYESSIAQGFTVDVETGKTSSKSQKRDNIKFDDELMSVAQLHPSNVSTFAGSMAYWLIYIGAAGCFAIVLFIYRRRLKLHANVDEFRSRKAGTFAIRRLKKSHAAMLRGKREEFYTELLSALWGFISDRLKIKGSTLNRENVYQRLQEGGVGEKGIEEFIRLIDDCEYAKYAPGEDASAMKENYDRAVQIINMLRKKVTH